MPVLGYPQQPAQLAHNEYLTRFHWMSEWIAEHNIKLSGVSTCFMASALLSGGCGLGFKSGWTAESQAWHCCSVSWRLTCLWSSCSKLWYTYNRTVMSSCESCLSPLPTSLGSKETHPPVYWNSPPLPDRTPQYHIHINGVFKCSKGGKAQLSFPMYYFPNHTL